MKKTARDILNSYGVIFASKPIEYNASSLINGRITLNIKVTGIRTFKLRMKVAVVLLRLLHYVLKCKINLDYLQDKPLKK